MGSTWQDPRSDCLSGLQCRATGDACARSAHPQMIRWRVQPAALADTAEVHLQYGFMPDIQLL